ncbi:hypothetical protein [Sphingomonas echinoides]|uniref:hypothetical protein n=1 Tax=Sphingomonas echinoides TaxID=59803 RepID=UPI002413A655|nr:hypothetical protein [Sphingomonas echinoides]
MMKRALAATWLALTATAGMAAQPQVSPCLSASEVSDLAQVILPEAIGAAGVACGSVLPASAAIRQTSSAMLSRYRSEADRVWPQAKRVIGKIGGVEDVGMLDSELVRPILTTMLVAQVTKTINVRDCASIERIVSALAPLPPRNTADVAAQILMLTIQAKTRRGEKIDLPVCFETAK